MAFVVTEASSRRYAVRLASLGAIVRRRAVRPVRLHVLGWFVLVALTAALLWQATSSSAQQIPQQDDPVRATTQVTLFDNDAPSPGFDPKQAFWGFGPHTVLIRQRDTLVFSNPPSNKHPHTVTSLDRIGSPFANPVTVTVGTRFDSSPTAQTLIQPGQSFTLDTAALNPGNYTYFCKLHPWMVAEFTVTERRLR